MRCAPIQSYFYCWEQTLCHIPRLWFLFYSILFYSILFSGCKPTTSAGISSLAAGTNGCPTNINCCINDPSNQLSGCVSDFEFTDITGSDNCLGQILPMIPNYIGYCTTNGQQLIPQNLKDFSIEYIDPVYGPSYFYCEYSETTYAVNGFGYGGTYYYGNFYCNPTTNENIDVNINQGSAPIDLTCCTVTLGDKNTCYCQTSTGTCPQPWTSASMSTCTNAVGGNTFFDCNVAAGPNQSIGNCQACYLPGVFGGRGC